MPPMRRGLAFTLFLLVGVAVPATAQLPDPRAEGLSAAERVQSLLERIKAEQEGLETLQADFLQYKESGLLLEPAESRGTFAYARPDRVVWDYLSPEPIRVVITEAEMLTWYQDLGRAERIAVGEYSERILEYLGASNSLAQLERYFDIQVAFPNDPSQPYRMELSPRYERVARRLAGMTLTIDSTRFVPISVRYEEADGDVTEYRFENLVINDPIPSERFDVELPPDVAVETLELGGA